MNTKLSDIFLTALAPVFWGTTYIVTTELLPTDKPMMAAMFRTLPAGILLIMLSRQFPNAKSLSWSKVLCLSFLNITCFQVLLFIAAYRLPGGVAALIGSIQPLIIIFLLFMINRVRPTSKIIIGTCATILGLSLLLLKPNAEWDMIGLLAALLGASSMALGVFLTKRWQPQTNILTFTGWQLCFGGLMLAPMAFSFETFPASLTVNNIIGYAYLALFGSVIAYSLWFRGIAKLPTIVVSILGALSPITATILGWICLNQSLTLTQSIGLVIVLISIFIVQQQRN